MKKILIAMLALAFGGLVSTTYAAEGAAPEQKTQSTEKKAEKKKTQKKDKKQVHKKENTTAPAEPAGK